MFLWINKKRDSREVKEMKEAEYQHKCRMEQLEYIRETERLKHQWELERQRIKSAEIRKAHERKWLEKNR